MNHVKSGQPEAVIWFQHAFEVQGVVAQPIDVLGQLWADPHQRPGRHRVALREWASPNIRRRFMPDLPSRGKRRQIDFKMEN